MAALDSREVYNNLKKKGFIDAPNRSDDHKYLEFYYNDKLILYTKVSHGSKDIGDSLIKKMYEQCKISKIEFINLVKCTLSQEQYLKLLKERNLIS